VGASGSEGLLHCYFWILTKQELARISIWREQKSERVRMREQAKHEACGCAQMHAYVRTGG